MIGDRCSIPGCHRASVAHHIFKGVPLDEVLLCALHARPIAVAYDALIAHFSKHFVQDRRRWLCRKARTRFGYPYLLHEYVGHGDTSRRRTVVYSERDERAFVATGDSDVLWIASRVPVWLARQAS